MPRWLNNTIYVMIAIVSMGCSMQGIKWKPSEKKNNMNQMENIHFKV